MQAQLVAREAIHELGHERQRQGLKNNQQRHEHLGNFISRHDRQQQHHEAVTSRCPSSVSTSPATPTSSDCQQALELAVAKAQLQQLQSSSREREQQLQAEASAAVAHVRELQQQLERVQQRDPQQQQQWEELYRQDAEQWQEQWQQQLVHPWWAKQEREDGHHQQQQHAQQALHHQSGHSLQQKQKQFLHQLQQEPPSSQQQHQQQQQQFLPCNPSAALHHQSGHSLQQQQRLHQLQQEPPSSQQQHLEQQQLLSCSPSAAHPDTRQAPIGNADSDTWELAEKGGTRLFAYDGLARATCNSGISYTGKGELGRGIHKAAPNQQGLAALAEEQVDGGLVQATLGLLDSLKASGRCQQLPKPHQQDPGRIQSSCQEWKVLEQQMALGTGITPWRGQQGQRVLGVETGVKRDLGYDILVVDHGEDEQEKGGIGVRIPCRSWLDVGECDEEEGGCHDDDDESLRGCRGIGAGGGGSLEGMGSLEWEGGANAVRQRHRQGSSKSSSSSQSGRGRTRSSRGSREVADQCDSGRGNRGTGGSSRGRTRTRGSRGRSRSCSSSCSEQDRGKQNASSGVKRKFGSGSHHVRNRNTADSSRTCSRPGSSYRNSSDSSGEGSSKASSVEGAAIHCNRVVDRKRSYSSSSSRGKGSTAAGSSSSGSDTSTSSCCDMQRGQRIGSGSASDSRSQSRAGTIRGSHRISSSIHEQQDKNGTSLVHDGQRSFTPAAVSGEHGSAAPAGSPAATAATGGGVVATPAAGAFRKGRVSAAMAQMSDWGWAQTAPASLTDEESDHSNDRKVSRADGRGHTVRSSRSGSRVEADLGSRSGRIRAKGHCSSRSSSGISKSGITSSSGRSHGRARGGRGHGSGEGSRGNSEASRSGRSGRSSSNGRSTSSSNGLEADGSGWQRKHEQQGEGSTARGVVENAAAEEARGVLEMMSCDHLGTGEVYKGQQQQHLSRKPLVQESTHQQKSWEGLAEQHQQSADEPLLERQQQRELLQREMCTQQQQEQGGQEGQQAWQRLMEVQKQELQQNLQVHAEAWEGQRQQWLAGPRAGAGDVDGPEGSRQEPLQLQENAPAAVVTGEGSTMRGYWQQFLFDSRGPSLDDDYQG